MSENTAPARTSFLLSSGVLVIALAAVFLVGLKVAEDDEGTSASRTDAQAYGIVTAGQGKVTATPDQLTFNASVTNTRPTTSAALTASNADVAAVTAAARKAGIDPKDIETTALSVRPKYRYDRTGSHLTGYSANQRLQILVRTLDDAGKVISAVTDAGGNSVNVSSIKLSLSNRDALIDEARSEAVAKSKASAEAIAQAAGRKVGKLEYVQEVDPNNGRGYDAYAEKYDFGMEQDVVGLSAAALPSVPIAPGEQDVTVTVQVRWSVAQ